MTAPRVPRQLGKPGGQLWKDVHLDFEVEAWQLPLLLAACMAVDRMTLAQQTLDAEGLVMTDRFGARRAHPAAAIVKDSSATLRGCLRELGFADPIGGPG